jgi:hypothetical protein
VLDSHRLREKSSAGQGGLQQRPGAGPGVADVDPLPGDRTVGEDRTRLSDGGYGGMATWIRGVEHAAARVVAITERPGCGSPALCDDHRADAFDRRVRSVV